MINSINTILKISKLFKMKREFKICIIINNIEKCLTSVFTLCKRSIRYTTGLELLKGSRRKRDVYTENCEFYY